MLVKTTAVGLIGLLNDAKELRSFVSQLSSGKKSGDGRFAGYDRGRVEGEVFKLNPTLKINECKVWRKELEEDIRSIERAVFSFNTSTKLTGEDLTISEALKEVTRLNSTVTRLTTEAYSNISYMRAPADDAVNVDLPEICDDLIETLKKKRYLKNKIAQVNARCEVELNIENKLLLSLL
jgi:hypothetical protein